MSIYKKIKGQDTKIAENSIIDHSQLSGRSTLNCHPISAIRNLPEKLTELKTKSIEIENKAKHISLTDNNDGTLTFKNFEGNTNDVKAGHLVDNTTIKEINGHSTLEVIGVKGTFEKEIDGEPTEITKVYDAEDIYDDIKSAGGISLEEGQNGTLIFTDYDGSKTTVQGGYLPDDETITLEEKYSYNEIELTEETYQPNKYYILENDGYVISTGEYDSNETYYVYTSQEKMVAFALKTSNNGILTGERINSIITSKGGYLDSYNFTKINPSQEELTTYAIQQVGNNIYVLAGTLTQEEFNSHTYVYTRSQQLVDEEIVYTYTRVTIYDPSETYYILDLWDKTRVINLYTNNSHKNPDTYSWDLNSEYWSNLGFIGTVTDANNDGLHGLVTGSSESYHASITSDGQIYINGLRQIDERGIQNSQDIAQEILDRQNSIINTYSTDTTKAYSANYSNNHFAPLSFLSKLYFNKIDNTNVSLVDTPPTLSTTNYLTIINSNEDFVWNSPAFTATRTIQSTTTLTNENSFTLDFNFEVNNNCNLSFGARVKVSTDNGSTWTYISTQQSYAQNTYTSNSLCTGHFIVYTDSLITNTTYQVGSLVSIEVFIKGTTSITLYISCGYTDINDTLPNLDNTNSYLQFNFSNMMIDSSQIQDGSVTYQKLDNNLQSKIDKIGDSALDTDATTLSGAVNELNSGKQANITGAATTVLSDDLTTNRVLISDNDGKIATSSITSSELSYLDGAASNIQNQLNSKANESIIADAYNNTYTYHVGDVVFYNNTLYKCINDILIPEDFDSNNWLSTTVDDLKQNKLTSAQQTAVNSGITSELVSQIGTNQSNISAINDKIPDAASSLNQLADKEFVNEGFSYYSPNYRGTFEIVLDLGLSPSATHSQVATAISSKIANPTANDYCFIKIPNQTTIPIDSYYVYSDYTNFNSIDDYVGYYIYYNDTVVAVTDSNKSTLSINPGTTPALLAYIKQIDRYEYNSSWEYKYTNDISGFSVEQWKAINSNITNTLVSQISTNAINILSKEDKAVEESYTIQTTDWQDLSSSEPYKFSTTVTATHTIGNDTEVGTVNDQPILFANYGFVVGALNGQSVTIYTLSKPDTSVTISISYRG